MGVNTGRPGFLPPLPLATVIVVLSMYAALQIHTLVGRFLAGAGQSGGDFFFDLSAARIGLEHGWAAVYDRQLYGQVTGYGRPLSFVNLPAVAWLTVPLTHLPFRVALLVWLTGLSALLLASWRLAAPGGSWQRLAHLAALLSASPVLRAMDVGQFSLAIVGLLALHWWLVERGRVTLAGVALGLACLKPQGVFLVPVALALTGRWRCAAAWLATVAGLGLAMALALGPAGVAAYGNGLRFSLDPATTANTLWQHLPGWVPTLPIRAVIALLALVPALFEGARKYGRAVAAAVAGSLLGTPYLIGQIGRAHV